MRSSDLVEARDVDLIRTQYSVDTTLVINNNKKKKIETRHPGGHEKIYRTDFFTNRKNIPPSSFVNFSLKFWGPPLVFAHTKKFAQNLPKLLISTMLNWTQYNSDNWDSQGG